MGITEVLIATGVGGAAMSIWFKFPWRSTFTCGFDAVAGAAILAVVFHFVV